MSGTTSTLSQIIANLESSGGTANASQPASMVNPTYGQYQSFAQQYGIGAYGVDNYANQMLAANPNATLGDYYASYVLGTGNPGAGSTLADLQGQQPAAYNNLINNAGVSPSTPLANLVSSNALPASYESAGDGFAPSIDVGGGATGYNPSTPIGQPGSEQTFTQLGGAGMQAATAEASTPGYAPGAYGGPQAFGLAPGLAQGIGGWISSIESAVGTAWDNSIGAILGSAQNWIVRGFLILIGLVLAFVALWRLAAPDVSAGDVVRMAAA